MRTNARLKKIERELQSQSRIHNADRFIAVFPVDTEEEEEKKIEKHLEKLRQKYGEDVSRQDIGIIRIIYDSGREMTKD